MTKIFLQTKLRPDAGTSSEAIKILRNSMADEDNATAQLQIPAKILSHPFGLPIGDDHCIMDAS